MQHHRRLGHARRLLQVADQLLALERNLDDLQRRIEELRGLAEHAQRVVIGGDLAGRHRRRIAPDAAGVERMHVKLAEPFAAAVGLGQRIGLGFVGEADLAPLVGPVVLVEALQRGHHLFGVFALDVLERVELAGAPHELGLDLIQRALAGAFGLVLDIHAPSGGSISVHGVVMRGTARQRRAAGNPVAAWRTSPSWIPGYAGLRKAAARRNDAARAT